MKYRIAVWAWALLIIFVINVQAMERQKGFFGLKKITVKKLNTDPYRGTDKWAWKSLKLNQSEQEELERLVKAHKWSYGRIRNGDEFIMVFDTNKLADATMDWGDVTELAKVYKLSSGQEVWLPLACNNWSVPIRLVTPTPTVSIPTAPYLPPVALKSPPVEEPTVISIPPITVRGMEPEIPLAGEQKPSPIFTGETQKPIDYLYDLYLGTGGYKTFGYDAQGVYGWGKGRVRPIWFNMDGSRLGLGVFGFGGLGYGNDAKYDYDWYKYVIGPTAKYINTKHHFDVDIDVGVGQLINHGGIKGIGYENNQTDLVSLVSLHLNVYGRESRGEVWFGKSELNFEGTIPISSKQEHSIRGQKLPESPYDNKFAEFTILQHIYKQKLGGIDLSYGVLGGLSHEFGTATSYWQIGPTLTITSNGYDIAQFGLGYKAPFSGDMNPQGIGWAWISPSGIIESIQAAQVDDVSIEDIKNFAPATADENEKNKNSSTYNKYLKAYGPEEK